MRHVSLADKLRYLQLFPQVLATNLAIGLVNTLLLLLDLTCMYVRGCRMINFPHYGGQVVAVYWGSQFWGSSVKFKWLVQCLRFSIWEIFDTLVICAGFEIFNLRDFWHFTVKLSTTCFTVWKIDTVYEDDLFSFILALLFSGPSSFGIQRSSLYELPRSAILLQPVNLQIVFSWLNLNNISFHILSAREMLI